MIKHLTESLTLTKKSIPIVLIFVAAIGIGVSAKVGFDTKEHILISSTAICLLAVLFAVYCVAVFLAYHRIPKNRDKNKNGVLFFVDTHGNAEYHRAIREKLYEQFTAISDKEAPGLMNPIFLTEKKVSVLRRAFSDKEQQKKLLGKAHCSFGMFLRATDEGKDSDTYELQMNAVITGDLHPILESILEHNFRFIIRDLREKTIDKKQDLGDLKNMGKQLYNICSLLIAVIFRYNERYEKALDLLDLTHYHIANANDAFNMTMKTILRAEMFAAYEGIQDKAYDDFCYSYRYDLPVVLHAQTVMEQYYKSLPRKFQLRFHLSKAIILVMQGNFSAAKAEIRLIDNQNRKTHLNDKSWLYSDYFIDACKDEKKKYVALICEYAQLKYNKFSATDAQNFIIAYQAAHEDNLGVKIALYCLTYYREDLSLESLPAGFKDALMAELKAEGLSEAAERLAELN